MNKNKKRRSSFKIYLSDDERREIDAYAKRIGFKKVSNLIRDAMLHLARDPSYDVIFDQGSLFKEEHNRTIIRQKFLEALDHTLDALDNNNLLTFPATDEEDPHDEQS